MRKLITATDKAKIDNYVKNAFNEFMAYQPEDKSTEVTILEKLAFLKLMSLEESPIEFIMKHTIFSKAGKIYPFVNIFLNPTNRALADSDLSPQMNSEISYIARNRLCISINQKMNAINICDLNWRQLAKNKLESCKTFLSEQRSISGGDPDRAIQYAHKVSLGVLVTGIGLYYLATHPDLKIFVAILLAAYRTYYNYCEYKKYEPRLFLQNPFPVNNDLSQVEPVEESKTITSAP